MRFLLMVGVVCYLPTMARAESTHRLYDGITAHVNNATGKDFTVNLAVRDLNVYETGPREVLVKIYDPDGKPVVREVLPDDGVTSKSFLPPMGAWDHEAWYYAYCYMKGTQPMIRWSAYSAADRLKATPKRDFTYPIKGAKKGIYRVLIVGCIDHYVTLKIDPNLPHAIAGHCDWIHGHGDQWRKSFVYLPQGTKGLHIMLAEYDLPRNRELKVTGPDGKVLFQGVASGAYTKESIAFKEPVDDQLLTVEVSPGPGDFLLGLKLRFGKDPEVVQRGERATTAVFAPDEATAKLVKNGAIYHDGRLFWHPFQVRFHDWLKKLPPEAFEVRDAKGELADAIHEPGLKIKAKVALPQNPGFIPVNGPHWRPTVSDRIMHHYSAHHNKSALNVALRDMYRGLRNVGPNDHVNVAIGGPFANMAYEFSNYAWHYWRPAWRILKEPDTPSDVKEIVREAFLVAGDRLAFCRTWERVNGNSFALIPTALLYCHHGTGDKLQKELFETYWDRFEKGGWGERVGVGPSGPIQEGFAYAYHYGSYIVTTWQANLADIPDPRMQKVYDRLRTWFSYTLAEENIAAGPWSARTHYYPQWRPEKDGPFAWKGLPGPDFTVSVNDGNEFFAARRPTYYTLTYHGRLSPKWESNAHSGQTGYGGGMLCQLQIPGKGPVLTSTLNNSYGEGMDPSLWKTFHLHTMAGVQADDTPFVAGDSEHPGAKLVKNKVSSVGDIRNTPLACERTFTFEDDGITCTAALKDAGYTPLLTLWLKNNLRGKIKEAYEMIPFVPKLKNPTKKASETVVMVLDKAGQPAGPLAKEPTQAEGILIDRGGFGVRILLDRPRMVHRGDNNTVMIRLVDSITPAENVTVSYRIVPFAK